MHAHLHTDTHTQTHTHTHTLLDVIIPLYSSLLLFILISPFVPQAVFGEIIEVPPGYTMSQTLTVYIQSRLLANDQIADMYYQPTITGRYGQGMYL